MGGAVGDGPGGTPAGLQAQRRREITDIDAQRRKLFELYYADKISPESFHAEDLRLNERLATLQQQGEPEPTNDSIDQSDRVLAVLAELDWDVIWDAATDTERRTLLDEFLVRLDVFPDHLEVDIRGAGKLNVALHEVGLRNRAVETTGVGGMSRTITPRGSQTTSGVSGVR